MDEHQWEEADSRRTNTAPRREEADGRAPTPRGEAEGRRTSTTPRREKADGRAPTPRGEAEGRRTSTTPRREEVDGRAPTPRGEAESRRTPRRVERRLEASPRRAARLYSRRSKNARVWDERWRPAAPLGAPADAEAPGAKKEAESRRVRVPCYRRSLCEGQEGGAVTVCTPVALASARATGAPGVQAEGLRHEHAAPRGRKSTHQHHTVVGGRESTH